MTISGRATLDDAPLDARWIGAVVLRDGLVTPCNVALPPIENSEYEIGVFTDEGSAGCGTRGSDVLLWTFVADAKRYATETLPWPSTGAASFDVDFSSTDPQGAAPTITEFSGEVHDSSGGRAERGDVVEAYVSSTLCGVASIRETDFYILSVAGPDAIAGCEAGGTITFVVDGEPATETAVNSPAQTDHLDLTVP